MRSAWDVMIDDETYSLLEEYYGREVELSTMVRNADRAGVIRLLDDIIEEWDVHQDDEMVARAREAKRRL